MITWDELANKHAGETGIIMACGPSLAKIDRKLYDQYPTIGVNRSYLLKEPDYFCMVEPNGLAYCIDAIAKLKSVKFIYHPFADQAGALPLYSIRPAQFKIQPKDGVYEGYTVTYVALQIAFWLGFQTILLAGIDHRYGEKENHFTEQYTADGMPWYAPDNEKVTEAYRLADVVYREHGRNIYNISPGSALEVFEKRNYEVFIR